MSLEHWRTQIDAIDAALVRLINERARCARMVGYLKQQAQLPIVDLEREREVYRNIARANAGPLDEMTLRGIFERIIDEMRLLQGWDGEPPVQSNKKQEPEP